MPSNRVMILAGASSQICIHIQDYAGRAEQARGGTLLVRLHHVTQMHINLFDCRDGEGLSDNVTMNWTPTPICQSRPGYG